MRCIYIRGGDGDSPGVKALRYHLENKGHKVVRSRYEAYDVILCWGVSTRQLGLGERKPSLNGQVNLYNKRQALARFADADIPVPTLVGLDEALVYKRTFEGTKPWFARNVHHEKGKDIRLCKVWDDVKETVERGDRDYFSIYIPHMRELRVWVFRDKAFAVYHKLYRQHGFDNYKNLEFRSKLCDDLLQNKSLIAHAIAATKVLKMDWGAVDILEGKDGEYYVLEVNSMPDISSLERLSGVRLAASVSQWAERL